ncbi:hypothetical protein HETIRDRAFT_49492, partial [Heterobasidion irregulare TC 32-1]
MLLRVLSQNVNCSPVITQTLLETKAKEYDIVLVQEPYWGFLHNVLSSVSSTGEEYLGTQIHPHWTLVEQGGPSCVATYINKCLSPLQPKLCTHLVNHPDLLLIAIPDGQRPLYILNVYNDADCTALHYLNARVHVLPAIDIMMGDLNLHNNIWDPAYSHNDHAVTELLDFTNSLGLVLLNTDGQPTHVPHARGMVRTSTIIDLIFVAGRIVEAPTTIFFIDPDGWLLSDHNPLLLSADTSLQLPPGIPRIERKSDAEQMFFADCVLAISGLNPTPPLDSIEDTQRLCDTIFSRIDEAFATHATIPSINQRSKTWWNNKCSLALACFRETRSREDWRIYRRTIRKAQRTHYDTIIHETADKQR